MKLGRLLVWVIVVTVSASVAKAARLPRQNALPAELRALQGTWNLVETDIDGQSIRPRLPTEWIFVGHELYLRTGGKTVPQGIVELTAGQKKAITLVVRGRPVSLGIYELRGRKLEVCASSGQRPAVFVAEGSNVVSVLERPITARTRQAMRIVRR
jgi:uncharacterized protein (TIGR03067 family)